MSALIRGSLALMSIALVAQAQWVDLPDLQLATVATGLQSSARTLGVDGAGTVWVGNVALFPGGGTLASTFTPRSVTRGPGGHLHFIADGPGGGTGLYQLSYSGQESLLMAWPNLEASSLAWVPSGEFFLATASDILVLPVGGTTPSVYVTGLSGDLGSGPTGRLFVYAPNLVHEITGLETATLLYTGTPWPSGGGCVIEGYYGHPLASEALCDSMGSYTRVVAAFELGSWIDVFGDYICQYCTPEPAEMAPGLAGDVYILSGDRLFHLTGTPALLSFCKPAPGQGFLRLEAPLGSPLIVAADVTGLSYSFPGLGTAHTSLGALPSFLVLADGIGAFGPLDPNAQTPWFLTVPIPVPMLGTGLALEAYVPHPLAENGVLMISNLVMAYL